MTNTQNYRRRGVPTSLLGWSYKQWTCKQLQIVLRHYGQPYGRRDGKLNLMSALHLLCQQRHITALDRSHILNDEELGLGLERLFDITIHQAIREAARQDCTVCLESLHPDKFPQRRVTASCEHEPDACNDCTAASIAAQLANKLWNHIDCPTCGKRLDYQDIKDFAEDDTFQR